jgi:hypothetical protein
MRKPQLDGLLCMNEQESHSERIIVLYESGPGWHCQHTLTEPPWEGAILLCKQCEYQASNGAKLVDGTGKPVPWDGSRRD